MFASLIAEAGSLSYKCSRSVCSKSLLTDNSPFVIRMFISSEIERYVINHFKHSVSPALALNGASFYLDSVQVLYLCVSHHFKGKYKSFPYQD